MPDECVPMYTVIAHMILEPLRTDFQIPIKITSGYRTLSENEAAGGSHTSQHLATDNYAAVDFKFRAHLENVNMRPAFDWLRQQTHMVWDQMILEHTSGAGDIIHISLTRKLNRREALEGDTSNLSAYESWPVAAYSVNA